MPMKMKIIPQNKKFIIFDEISQMYFTGRTWNFSILKAKKFKEEKEAFFCIEDLKFNEAKLYLQDKHKYEL